MRKFLPVVLSGAMAVSFSQIAFAQTTYPDSNPSDNNTRYNIHQRGDQNSTQFGTSNQSSQIEGSGNQVTQQGSDNTSTSTNQSGSGNTAATTTQQGTQNQSAVGEGNQQSQQMGSGHKSEQDSTWTQQNAQNRQSGDSAAAGGDSAAAGGTGAGDDDDDERRGNRGKGNKGKNTNKGWHKGWEDPASSGSTRY